MSAMSTMLVNPLRMKKGQLIEDYIDHFDQILEANDWSDVQAAKIFPAYLYPESPTLRTIKGLSDMQRRSYEAIKNAIKLEQKPLRDANLFELGRTRRRDNESIESYASRITRTVDMTYPSFAKANRAQLARDLFLMNLDVHTRNALIAGNDIPDSIEKVKNKVLTLESATKFKPFKPRENSPPAKSEKTKKFCSFCKKTSHSVEDCYAKNKEKASNYAVQNNDKGRWYLLTSINKQKMYALIDTGSTCSLVPRNKFEPSKRCESTVRAANQTLIASSGTIDANVRFHNKSVICNMYVADVQTPILGCDFITFVKGSISFNGKFTYKVNNKTQHIRLTAEKELSETIDEFEKPSAEEVTAVNILIENDVQQTSQKPHRIPRHLEDKTQRQIDNISTTEVIEESESESNTVTTEQNINEMINQKDKPGRKNFKISEFECENKQILGNQNGDADALGTREIATISSLELTERQQLDNKWSTKRSKATNQLKLINNDIDVNEPNHNPRLCILQNDVREILKLAHDEGGQLGKDKTLDIVRRRFYWPNLRNDVNQWITIKCKYNRLKSRTADSTVAMPQPTDISNIKPWQKIRIDLAGPWPTTTSGYQYLLGIQDYHTEWMDAIPLRETKTVDIIAALNDIWSIFSVLIRMITNQRSQLESIEFKLYCNSLQNDHRRSTAYHQQLNRLVELELQIIWNLLKSYFDKTLKDCDMHLPHVCAAYRLPSDYAIHPAIGCSPCETLFNKGMPIYIDRESPTWIQPRPMQENSIKAYTERLTNDYNQKVKSNRQLPIGSRVILKQPATKIVVHLKWNRSGEDLTLSNRIEPINLTIKLDIDIPVDNSERILPLATFNQRGRPKNFPANGGVMTQSALKLFG